MEKPLLSKKAAGAVSSCYHTQGDSRLAKPILEENLHMRWCMLYEPLQVLAQDLVCCLHSLSSMRGKLFQTANVGSNLGK